ncbi:MAG: NAD(+) diphosphatase [Lachnospiraceae bacterium]
MVHEIYPQKFDPAFFETHAKISHYALAYADDHIFVKLEKGHVMLPKFSDMQELYPDDYEKLLEQAYYLFSIDGHPYFLANPPQEKTKQFSVYEALPDQSSRLSSHAEPQFFFFNIFKFRELNPLPMVFAGATGLQIARWKASRSYCGRCGAKTISSKKERAIVCPVCGQLEYPKIAPAIIVAVKNGDKLLLVRNNYGPYQNLGLVAGFVEIGESFEDTIHREVMEEVGLKVTNIKYYKSQPWAFSDTEMIGFTADLCGDDAIILQESELSEGDWYSREEIPEIPYRLSVGSEMIRLFKTGLL